MLKYFLLWGVDTGNNFCCQGPRNELRRMRAVKNLPMAASNPCWHRARRRYPHSLAGYWRVIGGFVFLDTRSHLRIEALRFESIEFEFIVEGLPSDTQAPCGKDFIAAGVSEGSRDFIAFSAFEGRQGALGRERG